MPRKIRAISKKILVQKFTWTSAASQCLILGLNNFWFANKLVLQPQRKDNLGTSERHDEIQIPYRRKLRAPRISFGLVPLTAPFEESDPELRVLNAVSSGLLFERMNTFPEELRMTKLEFNRIIKSLRNNGQIFVNPDGKYKLSFDTSNYPNLVTRQGNL